MCIFYAMFFVMARKVFRYIEFLLYLYSVHLLNTLHYLGIPDVRLNERPNNNHNHNHNDPLNLKQPRIVVLRAGKLSARHAQTQSRYEYLTLALC